MSMFRGFGLAVVVLAVAGGAKVGFCGSFCDAWSGQLDFGMYGLCFSPYEDGNRPPDDVPVEQIREKLEIVAPYTEWVRSFSATSGLQEIPEEAKKLGLKVAMGAWIRHEAKRTEEIDNLIAKAEAGYVDIAVVGNEELWWRENDGKDAIDPCELVLALETVRQRLNDANLSHIPVTTADPWDALFKRNGASFKYQEVLDVVDVFCVNIYPFHEHAHISKAIEKLEETYSAVLEDANEAGPGKEVIIGETGWPSEEEHWGPAEPSLTNAARYFYEAQCWATRNNVKMFWFAAFDEKWKAEPAGYEDPPEYEAHWGIWDSNGVIKESFLPEHVFCEDFDPCVNPFCAYTDEVHSATEPNIFSPDGDSNGQFLRVLYDGEVSNLSSVTFDRTAEGPFSRIIAEFDFRMFGDGNNGDGFSFLLLPTSRDGTSGCHNYYYGGLLADEPKLNDTFVLGFDICKDWPCSGSDSANRIYISWDNQWYPDEGPIDIAVEDVDLDSGEFHRARIELRCTDGDTGLVSVLITPDVYDANHPAAVLVAENVVIGAASHPYKPYENRVEFAGRNGEDANVNADIDNIYVSYRTGFCGYFLEGDVNSDCRINMFDLASLAKNWLVNCNSSLVNEECMPE